MTTGAGMTTWEEMTSGEGITEGTEMMADGKAHCILSFPCKRESIFLTPTKHTPKTISAQRLFKIAYQFIDILYAGRNSHQIIGNAEFLPLLRR